MVPAALVAATFVRAAPERRLDIDRLHSTVTVQPNGSLGVTETLDVHFVGGWRGLHRTLPTERHGWFGPSACSRSAVLSVKSATGAAIDYQLRDAGDACTLEINVPGAVDTRERLTVEYALLDAARADGLHWSVAGNGWAAPIGSASADLVLPREVSGVRVQPSAAAPGVAVEKAAPGAAGSVAAGFESRVDGNRVHVSVAHGSPRQARDVDVSWNRGPIQATASGGAFDAFYASGWLALLPAAAGAIAFALWLAAERRRREELVNLECGAEYGLEAGWSRVVK